MKRVPTTLCILHQHPRILLGMKKRGFGMGKWNGFGGKVEEGEDVTVAATREMAEETGLHTPSLKQLGELEFVFQDKNLIHDMHVFRADSYDGVVTESEEMRPQWFDINDIPYNTMWPSDRAWLPLFLEEKRFRGRFVFADDATILEHEVIEI